MEQKKSVNIKHLVDAHLNVLINITGLELSSEQYEQVTAATEVLTEKIHATYDPIGIVTESIANNPDIQYAWRENISQSVQEEFKKQLDGKNVQEMTELPLMLIANNSARNFLTKLCGELNEFKPLEQVN